MLINMCYSGNDMFNLTDTTNIAITGIAGGGKTVLLTSLFTQLAEYEFSDFVFGNHAKLSSYREIRNGNGYGELFPFEKYREALSRCGKWPGKTKDCYHYSCELGRSDWKFFKQRLNFFDFPGERIADAAIAAMVDYGRWSDHILGHFKDHFEYSNNAEAYFDFIETDNLSAEKIVLEYKKLLANFIFSYKPLITPSTFLLDTCGCVPKSNSFDELVEERASGVEKGCEFAPLPVDIREKYPEIVVEYQKAYKQYRNEVALPLFNEIGRARRLVVLIDVPSLLMGGVGRYNDNRQILLDLFDTLRSDSFIGSLLNMIMSFWSKPLDRVAFVASKADLVHPADIQNGRLESLLKQMTARVKRILPEIEYECFVCSACQSTQAATNGQRSMVGKIVHNNPECKLSTFDVSELPAAWPDGWKAGDYRYYRVYPDVPENIQIPPRHLGLDKVFDFLTR